MVGMSPWEVACLLLVVAILWWVLWPVRGVAT